MRLIGWATVGVHLCCAAPRFRRDSAAQISMPLLEVYNEFSDCTTEEEEEGEEGFEEEGFEEDESERDASSL